MNNSSKREIFIAVIVGLTTGVIFSYLLFAKKPLSLFPKVEKEKLKEISPQPKEVNKIQSEIKKLIIQSPKTETIVNNPQVEITGQAPPSSLLIIMAEKEEKVLEISGDGSFKTAVNLDEGENQLNLVALYKDGQEEITSLTLIYQKE